MQMQMKSRQKFGAKTPIKGVNRFHIIKKSELSVNVILICNTN